MLLMPISVFALDFCGSVVKPLTTCRMVSPIIFCSVFNYDILNVDGLIVETGSLTLLNQSTFFFNFSQPQGDYQVRLCDNSTRQVFVELEDDRLIGIIFALIFVGFVFGTLGFITENFGIKVFSFGLAFVQSLIGVFIIWANEVGTSFVPVLRVNFYTLFILLFGIAMFAFLRLMIRIVAPKNVDDEDDLKW